MFIAIKSAFCFVKMGLDCKWSLLGVLELETARRNSNAVGRIATREYLLDQAGMMEAQRNTRVMKAVKRLIPMESITVRLWLRRRLERRTKEDFIRGGRRLFHSSKGRSHKAEFNEPDREAAGSLRDDVDSELGRNLTGAPDGDQVQRNILGRKAVFKPA
jgi:hypothetical protein